MSHLLTNLVVQAAADVQRIRLDFVGRGGSLGFASFPCDHRPRFRVT
jgi:hypothetical protein